MTDLSILIVTYNSGGLIRDCLASVPAACAGLDHEVIIVDNASSDGTPERLRAEHPQVKLIANTDNRGFAAANNQALEVARGDFLLLLNPDVVAHPESLSKLVEAMRADPSVGIAGARMDDGHGRIALTAYPPFEPGMILWQYLGLDRVFPYAIFGRYRRACERAAQPFDTAWVQGSCLLFCREVYASIGGLDDRFFLFCEEPDFCERAQSAGWRVSYVPNALVTHFESSVVSRVTETRVRHYHLSPLKYFRKRGRPNAVLALKIGFSVELGAKSLLRLVQWVLGQRQFAGHLRTYRMVFREMWRA